MGKLQERFFVAFSLSEDDVIGVGGFVESILLSFQNGEIEPLVARDMIVEALLDAANDDEDKLRGTIAEQLNRFRAAHKLMI